MANRVEFSVTDGRRISRGTFDLPEDEMYNALKAKVCSLTKEKDPAMYRNDGKCFNVLASPSDLRSAIQDANNKKKCPDDLPCVNVYVPDATTLEIKKMLTEKVEENSKLVARLEAQNQSALNRFYGTLFRREKEFNLQLRTKVSGLENEATTMEEKMLKVESENQALKFENDELEANLRRCQTTQKNNLAEIDHLKMKIEAMVEDYGELNEEISKKDAIVHRLQQQVDTLNVKLEQAAQFVQPLNAPVKAGEPMQKETQKSKEEKQNFIVSYISDMKEDLTRLLEESREDDSLRQKQLDDQITEDSEKIEVAAAAYAESLPISTEAPTESTESEGDWENEDDDVETIVDESDEGENNEEEEADQTDEYSGQEEVSDDEDEEEDVIDTSEEDSEEETNETDEDEDSQSDSNDSLSALPYTSSTEPPIPFHADTLLALEEAARDRKIAEKMAELKTVPFWNVMESFSVKMESIREKMKMMEERVEILEGGQTDDMEDALNDVEERLDRLEVRL